MGFSESTLEEHLGFDHTDLSYEVMCPVCAATPGGDPNLMTDDLLKHLAMEHIEHRIVARDLISFLDRPIVSRHIRRVPNQSLLQQERTAGTARPRRTTNVPLNVFSSRGLAAFSARESNDPLIDLVAQIPGLRRTTSNTNSDLVTQIQQLQVHHYPPPPEPPASRRHTHSHTTLRQLATASSSFVFGGAAPKPKVPAAATAAAPAANDANKKMFLLEEVLKKEQDGDLGNGSEERGVFVQELLVSALRTKRNVNEESTQQDEGSCSTKEE